MILALHAGAGTFIEDIESVCAKSLRRISAKEVDGSSSDSQLVSRIMELEKYSSLNCGIGSNLTEKGTVECEAAFICSKNAAFGAVASVSNCIHPIYTAKRLASAYLSNPEHNGLIQPMILVGPGADQYCKSLGIGIVENDQLKTEAAQNDYIAAKKLLDIESNHNFHQINSRLDTVGGVSVNPLNGYCEAGVSSGGILLKKEGRMGHSAHFGSAVWAEQSDNISVAISISGCGEALIRTHLSEKLGQNILTWDVTDPFLPEKIKIFLEKQFTSSSLLAAFPHERLLVGGLALIKFVKECILISFHNSHHFPFAFLKPNGKITKFKSINEKVGEFVCCSFNVK